MSGASVSSLGSSANASHLDITNLAPGEDRELFEERHWLFKLFSVLYTVGKERPLTGPKYAFLRIFLNSLQLWLLTVVPHYGWYIDADNTVWRIVSFQRLGEFLQAHGYRFYLVLLYTFAALLAGSVGLGVWLAYCLVNNRTVHTWLVKGLRWYGLIFTQVFYVTSLTLLLVALDCNYFSVPSSEVFVNIIFPDHRCWEMPHLVQVGVSVVCILFFVVMAGAMLVSEMELNPLTRNYMAINNTRVEGIGFVVITLATFASVMITSVKALGVLFSCIFLLLYYLYVKWVPFIHSELNYARCAAYAAALYSSALLTALAFGGGSPRSRLHFQHKDTDDFARTITRVMWVGLGPAALAGAFGCYWRLRYFSSYVVGLFRDMESSETGTVKLKFPYRFRDAREVEIAARCARRWLDEDTVDPDAMQLCENIIKAGMTQLPHDSMMSILYSSFLIDVQGSYQSGYAQLQAVKQRSPGPLERFAIYSREQDHVSRAPSGGTVDLISYVEFQRTHRLVTRAHKDALIATRNFWGLLLRSAVDIDKLNRALHSIELAVRTAERSYRNALGRHGSNTRLMRLYGKFLETVKLDPWGAAKWFAEADSMEELTEHTKDVLGGLDLGVLPRDVAMAAQGNMALGDGVMLIFINAQGIIQAASPQVHVMLGYAKNELQGRDVGIIMPPPFGDHHTAYVRSYVQSGASTMLDRTNEFIALTKNRTVCPIKMVLSKVTGLSEDSVFMGMLESVTHPKDEGRLWILSSGAVVAADERACDWLGYPLAEVMGATGDDFVVDKEVLQGILKRSKVVEPNSKLHVDHKEHKEHRASILEGLLQHRVWSVDSRANNSFTEKGGRAFGEAGSNSIHRPRMAWVHKYGDHVPFQTSFTPGALGSVRYVVVTLRRVETPRPCAGPGLAMGSDLLLVADNKGRILHVTAALAAALGRPVDTIRAGGMELLIPNPVGSLHGAWMQMLSVPQTQGTSLDAPPPPHSCRAGVPVYLCGYSQDSGPVKVPFKMAVEHRLVAGGGSRIHVMSLQHMSEEQSTSERCLRLRLDLGGTIVSAGPAPDELYGICPSALVGKSIEEVVDLFQPEGVFRDLAARRESGSSGLLGGGGGGRGPPPASAGAGAGGGSAGTGGAGGGASRGSMALGAHEDDLLAGVENILRDAGSRETTRLLLKLARRSAEAEGVSWRVGVTLPPDDADAEELARVAEELGQGEQQTLAELLGARVVPAVMRIRLTRMRQQGGKQQQQQQGGGGAGREGGPSAFQRDFQARFAEPSAFGSYDGYGSPIEASSGMNSPCDWAGSGRKSAGLASPLQRSVTSQASRGGLRSRGAAAGPRVTAGLCPSLALEVELWKSDLLSGVVEVDEGGKVLRTDAQGTPDSAALVLGTPTASLQGASLAELLPLPTAGITALLEASATPGGDGGPGAASMRGGLRSKRGVKGFTVGPPVPLRARHQGDGCLLQVVVQAVRSAGSKGTLYLMLRPDKPTTVQEGFVRWLRDSDTAGLARSTQLGVLGMEVAGGPGGGGGLGRRSPQPPQLQQGADRAQSLPGLVLSGAELSLNLGISATAVTPPSRFSTQLLDSAPVDAAAVQLTVAAAAAVGRTVSSPQLLAARPVLPPQPQLPSLASMRVTVNRGGGGGGGGGMRSEPGEAEAYDTPSAVVSPRMGASSTPDPTNSGAVHVKKAFALAVRGGEDTDDYRGGGSFLSTRSSAMPTKVEPSVVGTPDSRRPMDSKQLRVQSWVVTNGRDHGLHAKDVTSPAEMKPPTVHKMSNIADLPTSGSENAGVAGSSEEGDRMSSSDGGQAGSTELEGAGRMAAGAPQSSKEDSGASSMGDEAGAHMTDYAIGRRYKRLCRLLNSPLAQQPSKRVWAHGLLAVLVLVLAHVVMFVLMITHTNKDREQVKDLDNAAWACRDIHEIAIAGRALETVLGDSWYVPGLPIFEGPREATIKKLMDAIYASAMNMKDRHHGVYLGFGGLRELPTSYDLRNLWNSPALNITLFYDQNDPITGLVALDASLGRQPSLVRLGLWDAGNLYLAKALEVYEALPALMERGVNFSTYSAWRFIQANGMPVLFPAYAQSLDAMVEITAGHLREGYINQLIFLVTEGCVLCLLAAVYMWTTAQQFAWTRFELFNVFMHVPIGLTRGLAQMSIVLEPGEEEDDEEGLLNAAAEGPGAGRASGGAGDDDTGASAKPAEKPERKERGGLPLVFSMRKKNTEEDLIHSKLHMEDDKGVANTILRFIHRLTSCLHFSKTGDSRACTKRRLVPSWRTPLLLAVPVALWALVVIVFSVVCVNMLRGMDAPIATLNIVITFILRFQRVLFYTLESCAARSWDAMSYYKDMLSTELSSMNLEYAVMLYGATTISEAANRTHFRLASTGVLFGGESKPAEVIYYMRECLAKNQSLCQPLGSPFYEATHNGLDVLVKAQMSHVESVLLQPPNSTSLNSTDFKFIWATAQTDTEGGLDLLKDRFFETVVNKLGRGQTLQIVLFAVIWVWALWYLLLQVRPMLHRSKAEMRRIAELLCQLPGEMDIEAIVARAIGVQQPLPLQPVKAPHMGPVGRSTSRRRSIQFNS